MVSSSMPIPACMWLAAMLGRVSISLKTTGTMSGPMKVSCWTEMIRPGLMTSDTTFRAVGQQGKLKLVDPSSRSVIHE